MTRTTHKTHKPHNTQKTKTGEHSQRLGPDGWLVDELINFYFALLQQRDAALVEQDGRAPSHFFNSFFVPKLMGIERRLSSGDDLLTRDPQARTRAATTTPASSAGPSASTSSRETRRLWRV